MSDWKYVFFSIAACIFKLCLHVKISETIQTSRVRSCLLGFVLFMSLDFLGSVTWIAAVLYKCSLSNSSTSVVSNGIAVILLEICIVFLSFHS